MCKNKKDGGLGFRNICTWNKAVAGKLIWHIGCQKDNLLVKWVHTVYVKHMNWWDFQAIPGTTWVRKYLCKVKNVTHLGIYV